MHPTIKRFLSVLLLICCFAVDPPSGVAQPSIVGVSLSVGSIDNAQRRQIYPPRRALFSRLEISSMIARLQSTGSYLGASVSLGKWNDNVGAEDITWEDSQTLYSYAGTVLGARLTVDSGVKTTPMRLWAGFSRHWISGKNVGSSDIRNTVEDNHGTFEIGARLSFPVFQSVHIGLEVERRFRSVDPTDRVDELAKLYYGVVATYRL